MAEQNWKVKEGAELNIDDVAKIACALKSLAVYTAMACDEDDNPEDLKQIVEEGLETIDKLFDY
jgi:hypothetical protein